MITHSGLCRVAMALHSTARERGMVESGKGKNDCGKCKTNIDKAFSLSISLYARFEHCEARDENFFNIFTKIIKIP